MRAAREDGHTARHAVGAVLTGLLAALLVSACEPAATGEVVRIMPLGDSITEASDGRASYRFWLWKLLEGAGKPVDFVGGMHGVHEGRPRFADFDQDHEGHWGWTTGQIERRADAFAAQSRPHVVLVLLGTNDGADDIAKTHANLAKIVAAFRRHDPGVSILIATLPPVVGYPSEGLLWPDIALLNEALPRLVATLDEPSSRVILVDQWTGFDGTVDTYDGVHPDESGEKKLADRWFRALLALDPWRSSAKR